MTFHIDDKLLAALIGTVAGTMGYWFTTFWMKPILQYRELRSRILIDFIYYAQVINTDGLAKRMQDLGDQRIEANRKCSAELRACVLELPCWYKWWLSWRGRQPQRAATELMGFSNTHEYDDADRRM